MLAGLKPAARASLSDNIVEQITDLIARGLLKPGDRIPGEHQLCAQFSVGRTSVREALRSLSAMGIVQSHAGDGTFVSASLEDLIQTRLLLESGTAALAASRATAGDLEELAHAIRGMQGAVDDHGRYLEFDIQFHLTLAKATQNPVLQNLLSTMRAYLQAWIKEALNDANASHRAKLSIAEHKRILLALKNRDPDEARHAMSVHILSSSKKMTAHRRQRPVMPPGRTRVANG